MKPERDLSFKQANFGSQLIKLETDIEAFVKQAESIGNIRSQYTTHLLQKPCQAPCVAAVLAPDSWLLAAAYFMWFVREVISV